MSATKDTLPDKEDTLHILLAEMAECVNNFTSARETELKTYIEKISLFQKAKDQASKALDALSAIRLEEMSRQILARVEGSQIPHEQALEILRARILAQVFREGFSQKLSPVIAAVFGKKYVSPEKLPQLQTSLRYTPIPTQPLEDAYAKENTDQEENDHTA
ncbi:MAG: hypothetical protein QXQ53_05700 [Candidatus Methanosuratincola sp.]